MEKKANLQSWLPEGGINLFQGIKQFTDVAQEKGGIKIWKLSIGQPDGAALLSARRACAEAVMSEEENMHEYQDNGSPGVPNFAKKFIAWHQSYPLKDGLAYLPIPGIKPMFEHIPQACGHVYGNGEEGMPYRAIDVATMTDPGYPTPADQCIKLGVKHSSLITDIANQFVADFKKVWDWTDVFMMNYPHNPSGQVVPAEFWHEVCQYCQERGIRLFNDAAYAKLIYPTSNHATLASVAQDYPNLSWIEAYSASKVIKNGTGWRVGAMVGSEDFIGDLANIKGKADSGFFAPAAAGVLKSVTCDGSSIKNIRLLYWRRSEILQKLLESHGMQLAVQPAAGFFSLWLAPKRAFGQEVKDGEHFNHLMIENTGVVGVHFGPYIRYSVTAPVEKPEWQEAIRSAFVKAEVEY